MIKDFIPTSENRVMNKFSTADKNIQLERSTTKPQKPALNKSDYHSKRGPDGLAERKKEGKERAKWVMEAYPKSQKPQECNGMDFDHEAYMNRQKTVHAALFKEQNEVVLLYSDEPISLTRGLQIGNGPIWKRGAKGSTLPQHALLGFPEEIQAKLQQATQTLTLCHIEGTICALPKEAYRLLKT